MLLVPPLAGPSEVHDHSVLTPTELGRHKRLARCVCAPYKHTTISQQESAAFLFNKMLFFVVGTATSRSIGGTQITPDQPRPRSGGTDASLGVCAPYKHTTSIATRARSLSLGSVPAINPFHPCLVQCDRLYSGPTEVPQCHSWDLRDLHSGLPDIFQVFYFPQFTHKTTRLKTYCTNFVILLKRFQTVHAYLAAGIDILTASIGLRHATLSFSGDLLLCALNSYQPTRSPRPGNRRYPHPPPKTPER